MLTGFHLKRYYKTKMIFERRCIIKEYASTKYHKYVLNVKWIIYHDITFILPRNSSQHNIDEDQMFRNSLRHSESPDWFSRLLNELKSVAISICGSIYLVYVFFQSILLMFPFLNMVGSELTCLRHMTKLRNMKVHISVIQNFELRNSYLRCKIVVQMI